MDQDIPETFVHRAHRVFAELQHRAQARVLRPEARENRRDVPPPEAEGRDDMKRPLDPAGAGGHVIGEALHLAQNALRALHQVGALSGEPERPPAAIQ